VSRIYTIKGKADGAPRLVMAANPSQALRHVASAQYEVKAAGALEVADLMSGGAKVEKAGDQDHQQLPLE
jgi:hypothetical protein